MGGWVISERPPTPDGGITPPSPQPAPSSTAEWADEHGLRARRVVRDSRLSASAEPEAERDTDVDDPSEVADAPRAPVGAEAPVGGGAPDGGGARPRRRRVVPLLLAGALVGVATGVAGTEVAQRLTEDSGEGETVVADTPLDPLPTWLATGDATVVRLADGDRELRVDLNVTTAPSRDPGFREVWLVDRGVTRFVSLGVLAGGTGTFVIPAALDLAEFPVVDISLEPYDGEPAHSGDSIARGILPT